MTQMMIITHHHPQANEETTPPIITPIHQNDLVKYLFLYMEFGSFFAIMQQLYKTEGQS